MGRLDRAELRAPKASKLWTQPQHPDAHGLMPYEMAEIEECSNSLEQALRDDYYQNRLSVQAFTAQPAIKLVARPSHARRC